MKKTGQVETNYTTKIQGKGGPARSYWQVEPDTALGLLHDSSAYLGKKFEKAFKYIIPEEKTWKSPARFRNPLPKPIVDNSQFTHATIARWLIENVLCDPSRINTFFEDRLSRDLMYGSATGSTAGVYFNESCAAFDGKNMRSEFNIDIAYNQLLGLCNKHNHWEQRRMETIQR